jgi:chromosome segregation ATPase
LHTQYQRLCDLREQRRALQTQRDELKRTVDLVTERWSRSQRRYAEIEHLRAGIEHRRALQERCDDLEEKLARMQALGREVEQLRAETMRLDTVLRHSVTELGEAAEAKRLAEARLAKVQTELEQCRGSDEDPQAIAGLRETEFELRDVEDRIARLEALTEHLELATAEFETHSATLHRSKQRLESARAIEHEAECAGERVAARLARSQLDRYVCERAEKAQLNAEIRALECQIEAEEAERERLTEAIAARTLPTADDLAELGRIHARLHRSEQAEVGLQATIELDLGVPVELLCDGKRVELTVGPVLAREALSLRIPRVGNIDVVACGGTREDDRGDELAALMVALRRAGVADWEALERAYAERCADEGRIAEIERSLVMATRVLEAKLAHARQQTSEQAIEHARVGERVAAAERELDDVRARLAALQGARGDRARDELERTRHELQAQRARWHKQIAEHRTRFEAQRGAASEAVAETTRELQRALGREGAAQARCAQVRTELSEANGRLRAYLEQLEAFDRARAHDELQRIRASLEAAAEPEHGEDLELAQQDLHSARAQLDDAREQLAHCDGMIAQLGRGPSEADLAEYTAALADLERRVGEAHVRSDAWKALLEAALHVKAQQHRHIGDQLAPLLAERLAELTKGRYAGIVLSPDLALESVLVAGQRVAIDRLSEGVKEQLATLVRLVIAEQLRSFVVLDDQLAQTDADRGAWFRGVLSRSAKTSQVIALTCRPQDYLEPDQFAGPFEPHRCVDGRLTAIAVEHVIARTRG